MSRLSAYRWPALPPAVAVAASVMVAGAVLASPAVAGTRLTLKVSPDRGLVNDQVVTVSGRGVSRSAVGSGLTWFVTECTAVVRQRMDPATDTPHCDVADARAVKVGRDGTFSTRFNVRAGIVGDGYCGTDGYTTCVIALSTAKGQGTVVTIGFAIPKAATTTTTKTSRTAAT